ACQEGTLYILVDQCLSLSQAVPAANGLHLATTWRNCHSLMCAKENCGELTRATQRTLISQFIPAFRTLSTRSEVADPPAVSVYQSADLTSPPAVHAVASKPVLNREIIFYTLYILTCVVLAARWHWCR